MAVADAAEVGVIDTVYTEFSDVEGLKAATEQSVALGYHAKPAIHPSQVEPVNRAFTPSEEGVEWMEKILGTSGFEDGTDVGSVSVDGEMGDIPLVKCAQTIVARTELADERGECRPGRTASPAIGWSSHSSR